ncbi:hypothetical protein JCM10213_001876 [Rhodosporidiobolus nylandii]
MATPQQDERVLRRLADISHVLLVLSGKGGVGKSSVSVQLALSLLAADPSLRIGLLDVDLTGPSLPRMLGMEGRDVLASKDGWVPVYLDAQSVAAAAAGGEAGVSGAAAKGEKADGEGDTPAPAAAKGKAGGVLACMSIGFLLANSRESVVWRGPKKNAMIKQFLGEVSWGELDYLIVDTPPGTSDEHISLLETLRPILLPPSQDPSALPLPTLSSLLVSTPQAVALLDVSKELSFVRRTELPLLGLVENMSGYVCPHCGDVVAVFGKGGGEDFCRKEGEKVQRGEETVGCPFIGRIPIDRELVALLDDVAAKGAQEASEANGGGGAAEAGDEAVVARPNLVQRYTTIPSFKIVKGIAEKVRAMVEEQQEKEEREGRRLTLAMEPLVPVLSNESSASVIELDEGYEALEIDVFMREGAPTCHKHKNANCKQCYGGIKKQLQKLTKEGVKRAKAEAKANPKSNLFA